LQDIVQLISAHNDSKSGLNFLQRGVFIGTDLAIDYMNKEKGGRGGLVINVASTAGMYSNV
jgi:NAD(P)-dependent dehydrogenase (short-subunit alcohol dehydrogenase family)